MPETIRVLIVDDHALMRDSMGQLLEQDDGIEVVGTAPNADAALDATLEHKPDVVVMDIDMPGLSAFEAASRLRSLRPETRLLFLSAFAHDTYIEQALKAGARGYLTKSEPVEQVSHAIRQVADGRTAFSDSVKERLVIDEAGIQLADERQTRVSTLSNREMEVLRYLAQGLSKKEIANVMHISVKTVEGHSEKLMSKLDIHDRVELTRFAIREGLATPG